MQCVRSTEVVKAKVWKGGNYEVVALHSVSATYTNFFFYVLFEMYAGYTRHQLDDGLPAWLPAELGWPGLL